MAARFTTRLQDARLRGPGFGAAHVRAAVAIVALAAALTAALVVFGPQLSPDRYLLVLVAPAAVLGRLRRYLRDFVPLVALLLAYAACRGLAHLLNPHPFYRPQLRLDELLFHGNVASVKLQQWLGTEPSSVVRESARGIWILHFHVPLLIAFCLWAMSRRLFLRYAASLVVLSFAAALAFTVFPAAPPWAAAKDHLLPPLTHVTGSAGSSAASSFLSNPFAAMPSLHVGYAVLTALFVVRATWRTRFGVAALIGSSTYVLLQTFTVLYTADHYVSDAVAGGLAAWLSLVVVERFGRHAATRMRTRGVLEPRTEPAPS